MKLDKPRPIENISDEKSICGLRYVRVIWKDSGIQVASWEPLNQLREEQFYHHILQVKGLLYDDHRSKVSQKDNCNSPVLRNKKLLKSKSKKKDTPSSKKKNSAKKQDLVATPSELLLDEDSTSINDIRGANLDFKEGYVSPTSKAPEIKFTPFVSAKNQLTTHFYRDLIEYYGKCAGDNPPNPKRIEKTQPISHEKPVEKHIETVESESQKIEPSTGRRLTNSSPFKTG